MRLHRDHHDQTGQALVIMVVGFIAMLALAGLVIDGGNLWSQQRAIQNGSDAAAEAGTVVLAQELSGASAPASATGTCPTGTTDTWDLAVCKSTYGTATSNQTPLSSAVYTDYLGNPLTAVGGGVVPPGAQGVKTIATKQVPTYLAGVVGIKSFTASTQATAVVGVVTSLCPSDTICGVLPLTIPVVVSTCTGSGKLYPGTDPWPIVGQDQYTADDEAIVGLCKTQNGNIGGDSAGSVGWLDFGCGGTLIDNITNPCVTNLSFPSWEQTKPGNQNNVESAINAYEGKTVWLPLFDGTCKQDPGGTSLSDCPAGQQGVGNNTWYHIPTFVGFHLDQAYIQGSNNAACNSAPGAPPVDGNGSNGCLKGWFTKQLPAPGTINLQKIDSSNPGLLGVQLIR